MIGLFVVLLAVVLAFSALIWSLYGVVRFIDYFRRISSIGPNKP